MVCLPERKKERKKERMKDRKKERKKERKKKTEGQTEKELKKRGRAKRSSGSSRVCAGGLGGGPPCLMTAAGHQGPGGPPLDSLST